MTQGRGARARPRPAPRAHLLLHRSGRRAASAAAATSAPSGRQGFAARRTRGPHRLRSTDTWPVPSWRRSRSGSGDLVVSLPAVQALIDDCQRQRRRDLAGCPGPLPAGTGPPHHRSGRLHRRGQPRPGRTGRPDRRPARPSPAAGLLVGLGPLRGGLRHARHQRDPRAGSAPTSASGRLLRAGSTRAHPRARSWPTPCCSSPRPTGPTRRGHRRGGPAGGAADRRRAPGAPGRRTEPTPARQATGVPEVVAPTPGEAVDVLSSCRAVVGVDTGLTHIAVQQGTPTRDDLPPEHGLYPALASLPGPPGASRAPSACEQPRRTTPTTPSWRLEGFDPGPRTCPSGPPASRRHGPSRGFRSPFAPVNASQGRRAGRGRRRAPSSGVRNTQAEGIGRVAAMGDLVGLEQPGPQRRVRRPAAAPRAVFGRTRFPGDDEPPSTTWTSTPSCACTGPRRRGAQPSRGCSALPTIRR